MATDSLRAQVADRPAVRAGPTATRGNSNSLSDRRDVIVSRRCLQWRARGAIAVLGVLLAIFWTTSPAVAQVVFNAPRKEPVQFAADEAHRFADGETDVWILRGNCLISQGLLYARSREAVIWIERDENLPQGRHRVTVYLERNVTIDQQGPRPQDGALPTEGPKLSADTWLGSLFTDHEPLVRVPRLLGAEPKLMQLHARAAARRDPVAGKVVRRAEFAVDVPAASPVPGAAPAGMRRLRAFPRSDKRVQAQWFPDPSRNEWVAVISGGVTIIVDGDPKVGSVDISTDRLVLWTGGLDQPDLAGQTLQRDDTPLEFYLEGNIEFRQGDRVVTAKAMYYDVRNHVGIVLDAEMLATVKQFEGKLRFQASVLRQLAQNRFAAEGARFTTSRLGEPSFYLQANNVTLEDIPTPALDPKSGLPAVDPRSPQGVVAHEWMLTSESNFLYLEGVPVLYWPTLSTNLEEPGFYLQDVRLRSDNVFGTQIITEWNLYNLLGIKPFLPLSTWEAGFDYLSERGPAASTRFEFQSDHGPWFGGPTRGLLDAYFIHDRGFDNLGLNQRSVDPGRTDRGRVVGDYRQLLGNGYQLTLEVGVISDLNFMRQYFEDEWFNDKDDTTGLELKRFVENSSWSITTDAHINQFYTETQWLPRGDHFWIGQNLFWDRLTWFEHSSAAYAEYRVATVPSNDPDFELLPWEVPSTGGRFATRQEIDLPFEAGPMKFVPYALGELAHWGEDLSGEPIDRAYGQVGIRASLPMWKVDPTVVNQLLNVHGLAHKVTFEAEFAFADANQDVTEFPLYDPIDDDSVEQFRHRYVSTDFGGMLPPEFDPRYYAIRAGLAGNVTSPSTEIADDLMALRLGAHQRWQTKRGMPGAERIIDWITFDTDLVIFPDADRDNFGSLVGLIDYDFRWHVGDRLTLLSDGLFDTFSEGQKIVSIGGLLRRPDVGSLYLGLRSIDGPISAQLLVTQLSYRMSPKWIASLGATAAVGGEANVTEQLTLTRIGESFLVRVGVYSDEGQGTVGAKLAIEPRFFRSAKNNMIDDIHVPPAGSIGLD